MTAYDNAQNLEITPMNPHKLQSATPIHMVKSLFDNRTLIIQLTKISVVARYKGSFFGLAWVFISPIVMLMIYGFVFTHIFKASWVGVPNPHAFSAALMIFAGLIFSFAFSRGLDAICYGYFLK